VSRTSETKVAWAKGTLGDFSIIDTTIVVYCAGCTGPSLGRLSHHLYILSIALLCGTNANQAALGEIV